MSRGYAVTLKVNGATLYLKSKLPGDKQELITDNHFLAGFWPIEKAEKVAARWERKGYETRIMVDFWNEVRC